MNYNCNWRRSFNQIRADSTWKLFQYYLSKARTGYPTVCVFIINSLLVTLYHPAWMYLYFHSKTKPNVCCDHNFFCGARSLSSSTVYWSVWSVRRFFDPFMNTNCMFGQLLCDIVSLAMNIVHIDHLVCRFEFSWTMLYSHLKYWWICPLFWHFCRLAGAKSKWSSLCSSMGPAYLHS